MIEINNIVVSVGEKEIRTVPEKICIDHGELVLVTGDNGAGKTSLINAICGQLSVKEGEVVVDKTVVSVDRRKMRFANPLRTCERLVRKGLGRNFQEPRLFWNHRVEEHIACIGKMKEGGNYLIDKLKKRYDTRKGSFEKTYCRELSYGQQRLLGISLALGIGERYCLLDEPFAGMSKIWAADVVEAIKLSKSRGVGIVVVEHRVGFLEESKDKELRVVCSG